MVRSGKKGYLMADAIYFYGVLAFVILLAIISPVVLMRHRRINAKVMKDSDMMESRVYKAVAENYGVTPNLVAECLAPEREAIFAAMTRCDSCGSVEECRHFFDQPGSDIDEAREFCPNAGLFIDLADFTEKQR